VWARERLIGVVLADPTGVLAKPAIHFNLSCSALAKALACSSACSLVSVLPQLAYAADWNGARELIGELMERLRVGYPDTHAALEAAYQEAWPDMIRRGLIANPPDDNPSHP
jgi:hypothetical protein